jgi:hypothetical protein
LQSIILDLDLDFFLNDIATWGDVDDGRLDSDFLPWTESDVRHFLETQCLLSLAEPRRGAIVKRHDEVFWIWRKMVEERKIAVPFEIVHVDAHADLGLGDAGYAYIMTDLLFKSLLDRTLPDTDQVTPGNFLSFAVACRWVSRLTYVLHPRLQIGRDLPNFYFKDFDTDSGYLQLKGYTREQLGRYGCEPYCCRRIPLSESRLEPEVPFRMIRGSEFQAEEPFSHVFLTCSPEYTPATADDLIPIIREYIREI